MIRAGAALCFVAVALGAFGAHAFRDLLQRQNTTDIWRTAVLYHFLHAIAIFVIALHGSISRGPAWLFAAGILIFSGSLYLLAVTNVRWLGAITPIGGLCFLAGWAWLVFAPAR